MRKTSHAPTEYQPSHMRRAKAPAHMRAVDVAAAREAGRRALHVALSVALAASLVPVLPSRAIADDESWETVTTRGGATGMLRFYAKQGEGLDLSSTVLPEMVTEEDNKSFVVVVTAPEEQGISYTTETAAESSVQIRTYRSRRSYTKGDAPSEVSTPSFSASEDGGSCQVDLELPEGYNVISLTVVGEQRLSADPGVDEPSEEDPPSDPEDPDPEEPEDEEPTVTTKTVTVLSLDGLDVGSGSAATGYAVLVDTKKPELDRIGYSVRVGDPDVTDEYGVLYVDGSVTGGSSAGRVLTLDMKNADSDDLVTVTATGTFPEEENKDTYTIEKYVDQLGSSDGTPSVTLDAAGYYEEVTVSVADEVHDTPATQTIPGKFVIDRDNPQVELEVTVNGRPVTYDLSNTDDLAKLAGETVYLNGSKLTVTLQDDSYALTDGAFDENANEIEAPQSPDVGGAWTGDGTTRTKTFSLEDSEDAILVIPVSDRAGHKGVGLTLGSTKKGPTLVIDSVPPEIEATFVDVGAGAEEDGPAERSLSELLSASHAYFDDENLPFLQSPARVRVTAKDGHFEMDGSRVTTGLGGGSSESVEFSMLEEADGGDSYVAEITYGAGDHVLPTATVVDKAGNRSELKIGKDSTPFVVDPEPPEISVGSVTDGLLDGQHFAALDGTLYLNTDAATVGVELRDRALNTKGTEVLRLSAGGLGGKAGAGEASALSQLLREGLFAPAATTPPAQSAAEAAGDGEAGVPVDIAWEASELVDGKRSYTAAVGFGTEGRYLTPHVHAVDVATNEADAEVPDGKSAPETFVVDLTPPKASLVLERAHADGTVTPGEQLPKLDTNNDQGKAQAQGFAAHVSVDELNWPTQALFRQAEGLSAPAVELLDERDGRVTGYSSVSVGGWDESDLLHPNTLSIAGGGALPDGTYRIAVTGTDLAGNGVVPGERANLSIEGAAGGSARLVSEPFILDATDPVINVSWDDEGASNGKYYDAGRTAIVTIDEANFNPGLMRLDVDSALGSSAEVLVGGAFKPLGEMGPDDWRAAWQSGADDSGAEPGGQAAEGGAAGSGAGACHQLKLRFEGDDSYRLRVGGSDPALNVAAVDEAAEQLDRGQAASDGEHAYVSTDFVIDTTPPELSITYPENYEVSAGTGADGAAVDRLAYFRRGTYVTVSVTDRNFDAATTSIDGAFYEMSDDANNVGKWVAQPADRGNVTYTIRLPYLAEGTHRVPQVVARDLAWRPASTEEGQEAPSRNETRRSETDAESSSHHPRIERATSFVVDLTAPQVDAVGVASPVSTGDNQLYWFYNRPTSVTLSVSDAYPLSSVTLADRDGVYDRTATISGRRTGATIVVDLQNGEGASRDTEFDRKGDDDKILLTVADVAGNVRRWNISRSGAVSDASGSSPLNTSLGGRGIYPVSLIQDTSAPVVGIAGVTAGSYSATTQTARVSVHELNFGYLQRFAGNTSVLRVTKYAGDASRGESSWSVPASSLAGGGSDYVFDQDFAEDGHYVLEAGFADYAHNRSNTASVGEFTIDKTPPVLEVSFDNNDVRNGRYYNAARTATIHVTEHNFDEGLFSITTNGAVGGWSSSGDVHVATVSFAGNETYNLSVSGSDRAGNAATPYQAEEFVVDTVVPTITFGGAFGDHELAKRAGVGEGEVSDATNGTVAPKITFEDSANFDENGTRAVLINSEGDEVSYARGEERIGDGSVVTFEDFAYDIAVDDIYTLSAHIADLSGNEADDSITFSVNRFGSTYYIDRVDVGGEDHAGDEWLTASPEITMREISVSGHVQPAGISGKSPQSVLVTRPDASSHSIEAAVSGRGDFAGYVMEEADQGGWHEYTYRIGRGNFGDESGEGSYAVNLTSVDAAGNENTTTSFFKVAGLSDASTGKADTSKSFGGAVESSAEVAFTLDTVAPKAEIVSAGPIVSGDGYTATLRVTDDIKASRETVEVSVNGALASDLSGPDASGNYTFTVPARSFAPSIVHAVVTDYAGRKTGADAQFYVTSLLPELAAGVGGVTVVGGGTAVAVVLLRRRRLGV